MGGIRTREDGAVLDTKGEPVKGLWCAGEVLGGIHGKNRLGGSSLLDCVVYGRVSGRSSCDHLLNGLVL
jgi:succinate dehydrogenase/fumarate reductase flavoprotein subunit